MPGGFEVEAPPSAQGSGKSSSPSFFAACCGCCCFIVACILVLCTVMYMNYEGSPEIDVERAHIQHASVEEKSIKLTMDTEFSVYNPNGWPWSAEFDKVEVDVWSLKNVARQGGTDKEPIKLGHGSLKDPFLMETYSNGTLHVHLTLEVVPPESAKLFARFRNDCCLYGTSTNMRAKLVDCQVQVGGSTMRLSELEIDDITVPCENMFEQNVCATMRGSFFDFGGPGIPKPRADAPKKVTPPDDFPNPYDSHDVTVI